jgi:hypothetical protein
MSVRDQHPSYIRCIIDWKKVTDAYAGERTVKEQGAIYLPPTPGQVLDGMNEGQQGKQNYDAYRARARFPDFVSQAVEAMIGTMHRKPAVIKLPARLEPMMKRATLQGESLQMLLRRINEQQLVVGRCGILADVVDGVGPEVLPYVAMYSASDIINWDDGQRNVVQQLNLIVLNESEYVRNNYVWQFQDKYRVLLLDAAIGTYKAGLFTENSDIIDESKMLEPSIAGRKLDRLPFVVINSKDVVADPDNPPLLGLAELAYAVYMAEADYRQAIFMTGQDTLIVVGGGNDETFRVGAGARIDVPMGGSAQYIGVSGSGIGEMRQALAADRSEAAEVGGRLLDSTGGTGQSGDALRIRVSARTASLNQVALAGAEGLQTLLRTIAVWVGANPDEVVVTPNLDFADDPLNGGELVNYMTAKGLGAPLSNQSIHRILQRKDITDMTYDEELAAIEEETMMDLVTKAKENATIGLDAITPPAQLDANGNPLPPA